MRLILPGERVVWKAFHRRRENGQRPLADGPARRGLHDLPAQRHHRHAEIALRLRVVDRGLIAEEIEQRYVARLQPRRLAQRLIRPPEDAMIGDAGVSDVGAGARRHVAGVTTIVFLLLPPHRQ